MRKNEGHGNGYSRYRYHILRRALPCTPPNVAGLFSAGFLTVLTFARDCHICGGMNVAGLPRRVNPRPASQRHALDQTGISSHFRRCRLNRAGWRHIRIFGHRVVVIVASSHLSWRVLVLHRRRDHQVSARARLTYWRRVCRHRPAERRRCRRAAARSPRERLANLKETLANFAHQMHSKPGSDTHRRHLKFTVWPRPIPIWRRSILKLRLPMRPSPR